MSSTSSVSIVTGSWRAEKTVHTAGQVSVLQAAINGKQVPAFPHQVRPGLKL